MNNPNIQLIAADVDGTLLNSQKKISAFTIATIKHVQQQDVSFVLATGRGWQHFSEVRSLLNTEAYPQNYYIVYNGAQVYDGHGTLIHQEAGISPAEVSSILQFAEKNDIEALCYTDTARWRYQAPGFTQRRLEYLFTHGLPMEDNVERLIGGNIDFSNAGMLLPSDCMKIALLHSSKRLQELLPELKSAFPQYHIMMVTPSWLEIVPAAVSKAAALKYILERTGISSMNAAAFGDGENDIAMLKEVKYGYAMANGFPEVLRSAPYTAPSNDEDGVAKTIIQLCGYDISLFNSFR